MIEYLVAGLIIIAFLYATNVYSSYSVFADRGKDTKDVYLKKHIVGWSVILHYGHNITGTCGWFLTHAEAKHFAIKMTVDNDKLDDATRLKDIL